MKTKVCAVLAVFFLVGCDSEPAAPGNWSYVAPPEAKTADAVSATTVRLTAPDPVLGDAGLLDLNCFYEKLKDRSLSASDVMSACKVFGAVVIPTDAVNATAFDGTTDGTTTLDTDVIGAGLTATEVNVTAFGGTTTRLTEVSEPPDTIIDDNELTDATIIE